MNDHIELSSNDVVAEYKNYVTNSVLSRGFDFKTWCQHQFGAIPDGLTVEPRLEFCVTDSKTAHK